MFSLHRITANVAGVAILVLLGCSAAPLAQADSERGQIKRAIRFIERHGDG